jgi:hypothetical protein
MTIRTILIVFLILAVVGVTSVMANAGNPNEGMGQQAQNQTQAQVQDQIQEPLQNQTQEQAQNRTQEQLNDQIQVQIQDQTQERERLQNQTRTMNVTQLHQQIQERKQEQYQLHAGLPPEQQRMMARYSNVSAFVYVLLNESQTQEMLGGIGPQVATYAREFNNSLQAQIRAEERIGTRNTFVRFFVGGDEEAAGTLEQETIRNQERIQQMQQLITHCQDCDPQIQQLLQEQLQEMEQQQTRLQQLAQKEKQDKGVFGWLWK